MVLVDRAAFEDAVADALDAVPAELLAMLDNVVFLVEDEPPHDEDQDLLGLYEGTPLTDRGDGWAGSLPDRITLYQGPLMRSCDNEDQLRTEIAVTVVHEIAHHFGIAESRLHELGWG